MAFVLRLFFASLVLLISVIVISAAPLGAAELPNLKKSPEGPFLLIADEVTYDKELDIVTAKGNVEISNGGRVLKADTVNYNQRDGVVTAAGNISLTEPTGEVAFAEYMKLNEKLSTGFIESVRVLLTDNSRFAANGARRYGDERTEMAKAVYSPCQVCKSDPSRPLVWQVKAVKIIHRRDTREIEYQDATLEIFGVPVIYLPFFRHPDPTVERASGFLAPSFGNDSELGLSVKIPYFFNIASDKDFTFEPIITTREGVVLVGEYRQLTENGRFQIAGSANYTDKRNDLGAKIDGQEFRGHVEGAGRFTLPDDWRWGWKLSRASDDTYLSRYNFSNEDTLTSNIFINKVNGTRYASAAAYTFQGLTTEDDSDTTPYVAPLLDYSFLSDPLGDWGRVSFDASAVSLYRTGGTDSRRFSIGGEWRSPHIGPIGDVYTLIAALRGDIYWSNDVAVENSSLGQTESSVESRLIPVLALDWRYPWTRQDGNFQSVIEPIIQAIYSPNGLNDPSIPNEDSVSFEFDSTNLFSLNRFPGYDRVESGTRFNMGLKGSIYGADGGYASFTVGQVYRVRSDSTFPANTGLDDNLSDIVSQVTISPGTYLDLVARVRINNDDLSIDRPEVYVSVGPPAYRLTASYLRLEQEDPLSELEAREEIFAALRILLSDNWSVTAHNRRDLTSNGGTIRTGGGLQYQDECITLEFTVDRDNTSDRDAQPSTSINFRIVLKNLG